MLNEGFVSFRGSWHTACLEGLECFLPAESRAVLLASSVGSCLGELEDASLAMNVAGWDTQEISDEGGWRKSHLNALLPRTTKPELRTPNLNPETRLLTRSPKTRLTHYPNSPQTPETLNPKKPYSQKVPALVGSWRWPSGIAPEALSAPESQRPVQG